MASELTIHDYQGEREGLQAWFQQGHPAAAPLTIAETAPLENEQAARDYLHHHVTTDHPAVAVPFRREVSPEGETAGQRKLRERLEKAQARVQGLAGKGLEAIKGAKAANVGCKKCGSRIARKFLTSHLCPVCGESLFPAGTQKRYDAAQQEVVELTASLRATPGSAGGVTSLTSAWLVGVIAAETRRAEVQADEAPTNEAARQPAEPFLFPE